jgi:DNA-binding transcriptional LysR family regulator
LAHFAAKAEFAPNSNNPPQKISELFTDQKWSGPRWRKTIGAVPWAGPRRQAAAYDMTNIPTELLRTLVTVVELRSFTKAAQCLGMTQPAVSAQIKRLQILLGGELLDKSAPGVALTPKGETVVRRARQLLSVNDQIVDIARPRPASGVRIGIADEALSSMLSSVLGACRRGSPGSLEIRETEDPLRDLRQGELDLAIALGEISDAEAHHRWTEPLVWVCAPALAFGRGAPLPVVLGPGAGEITRVATAALERSGAEWESACRFPSSLGCAPAVAAGLGIGAALQRFIPAELAACDDPRLPPLPELACGVFLRETAAEPRLAQLADLIAEMLRPAIVAPSAIPPEVEEPATQFQTEH